MSKDLTDALASLTEHYRRGGAVANSLPPPLSQASIPPRTGSAGPKANSGGGIASPLVEGEYKKREFYPERNVSTTDGIVVVKLKPVKKIFMMDAGGSEVVIEFAEATNG